MDQVFAWLWAHWPLGALALLTFVILVTVSPYGRLWKSGADRKRVVGKLMQEGWRPLYTRNMRPILDWFDAKLSADEIARGLGPKRVAWSHDLIIWTMLPAVAYPVLSFIGQWAFGRPLVLADAELAPPGEWRALTFFWLWLGGASAILVLSTVISRRRLPLFVLAFGILFGGAFLTERVGIPAEVAGAVAVAFAGAFAGAVAVAVAVAFAVAGAVAFAGAVAGAVAVAFAVVLTLEFVQDRRGRHPAWWLAYLLVLLAALTIAIFSVDAVTETSNRIPAHYLVLFLGVFPILNAAADFASIGLTRHLLRQGIEGRTWVNALKDFAGGAAIFAALGCALITWVHLVRPGDGTPLLDLAALFAALEASPGDHWWLFVMLFSTVLPTLLHAMVGLYTLLLHYPAWLRRRVVALLDAGGEGYDVKGWWGSVIYCGMLTLSVWVPLWATWAFFTFDHARVLDWIVAGFRWYAALIGAI